MPPTPHFRGIQGIVSNPMSELGLRVFVCGSDVYWLWEKREGVG
jgi:hypothetical protein